MISYVAGRKIRFKCKKQLNYNKDVITKQIINCNNTFLIKDRPIGIFSE